MLCRVCERDRRLQYFPKAVVKTGRICKDCKKKRDRIAYIEDPTIKYRRLINWQIRSEKLQQIVFKELAKKGCIDCGTKDPLVMKFHLKSGMNHAHTNKSVTSLVQQSGNERHIFNEIEQCVARCGSCQQAKEYSEEQKKRETTSAKCKNLLLSAEQQKQLVELEETSSRNIDGDVRVL